jgi:DNA-binding response OmpR family regulator
VSLTAARILIVEDNAFLANDLAEELESRGVVGIQMAACMRDAVRAVSDGLPDIAIIDLTLSDGQTGAQLARVLARSGVKVCVLSGRETLAPELMGISHTFIAKPAPSHIVASVIESQINPPSPMRDSMLNA